MDDLSVKKNIRFYRERAGKTQQEMADLLEIDRSTYNSLETGRTSIIKDTLSRIAEILEVPLEKLFFGEEASAVQSKTLEENDSLREQMNALKDYYEKRISELEQTNSALRQTIDSQASILKRYDQIINLQLRKQ